MSTIEDSEIIKLVVGGIKEGRFTIKHIVKELLPKKEKKIVDKKEYFKKYYEKNRENIIKRVTMNNMIKHEAYGSQNGVNLKDDLRSETVCPKEENSI